MDQYKTEIPTAAVGPTDEKTIFEGGKVIRDMRFQGIITMILMLGVAIAAITASMLVARGEGEWKMPWLILSFAAAGVLLTGWGYAMTKKLAFRIQMDPHGLDIELASGKKRRCPWQDVSILDGRTIASPFQAMKLVLTGQSKPDSGPFRCFIHVTTPNFHKLAGELLNRCSAATIYPGRTLRTSWKPQSS